MIHYFTFLTDPSRIVCLEETCAVFGIKLHVIFSPVWKGYTDKIFMMQTAIEHLKDDDIVLFTDAYDVLVNSNEETIVERFTKYNTDLVISSELNCYPERFKDTFDQFENTNNYKYINSGGYIGYKRAIMKVFTWKAPEEIIRLSDDGGDQAYFMEYYLANRDRSVKIDKECKLFQCLHSLSFSDIKFKAGQLHNIGLNIAPCFIHFNGGTWLDDNLKNIMPTFVQRIKLSRYKPVGLDDIKQRDFHKEGYIVSQMNNK